MKFIIKQKKLILFQTRTERFLFLPLELQEVHCINLFKVYHNQAVKESIKLLFQKALAK